MMWSWARRKMSCAKEIHFYRPALVIKPGRDQSIWDKNKSAFFFTIMVQLWVLEQSEADHVSSLCDSPPVQLQNHPAVPPIEGYAKNRAERYPRCGPAADSSVILAWIWPQAVHRHKLKGQHIVFWIT